MLHEAVPVLVCRKCNAPVTREVAQLESSSYPAPPPAGFVYSWNEDAASALDRHLEPVREELDGWLVMRVDDPHADVVYAGNQRSCRNGHRIGRVDHDLDRDGTVIVVDPSTITMTGARRE